MLPAGKLIIDFKSGLVADLFDDRQAQAVICTILLLLIKPGKNPCRIDRHGGPGINHFHFMCCK